MDGKMVGWLELKWVGWTDEMTVVCLVLLLVAQRVALLAVCWG